MKSAHRAYAWASQFTCFSKIPTRPIWRLLTNSNSVHLDSVIVSVLYSSIAWKTIHTTRLIKTRSLQYTTVHHFQWAKAINTRQTCDVVRREAQITCHLLHTFGSTELLVNCYLLSMYCPCWSVACLVSTVDWLPRTCEKSFSEAGFEPTPFG